GYPEMAPYDRISITAACARIPSPLISQLGMGGRLILPVIDHGVQNLVLLEKNQKAVTEKIICEVLYVDLRGKYGVNA
ncbi:MAG: protein-L-isoaspartate O-methyltransferase, partial [Actinomycetia bacterium]|nr:protein-L-isoaspartate O-methyltransferase [Actinomycetes bacterium]